MFSIVKLVTNTTIIDSDVDAFADYGPDSEKYRVFSATVVFVFHIIPFTPRTFTRPIRIHK